jgi:uncharacterized protein
MDVPLLVKALDLQPHPEGGYYKETYRGPALTNGRSAGTAIYFLLEPGNFSAFHRIDADECWHFYSGIPLWVHVLHPNGHYERIELGNDFASGARPQALVKAGCWFASECAGEKGFSLVGCTVSPGFLFDGFELAKANELVQTYPQHQALIERLCRV